MQEAGQSGRGASQPQTSPSPRPEQGDYQPAVEINVPRPEEPVQRMLQIDPQTQARIFEHEFAQKSDEQRVHMKQILRSRQMQLNLKLNETEDFGERKVNKTTKQRQTTRTKRRTRNRDERASHNRKRWGAVCGGTIE